MVSCAVDLTWLKGDLAAGLGLGLAEGVDGPASLTGCASFCTGTTGPTGGDLTYLT